jgi:glycogen debranching enzyme
MVSATADLAHLRAPGHGGLFGSGGVLFSDAIFGRDSVTAAETLLHLYPDVARDVILTLARLQGVVEAPLGPHSNEEEPGKIHHEHRSLYVGSRRISATSERLLRELAGRWGGDEASLTYYGSVDATPLYARLVAHHCAAYGDGLLAATVTHRDGRVVTIRESLQAALDWITRRMDSSEVGFVEFLRRNPDGIPFQVWKDSGTSYIHRDGNLANWDAPIAAIEVQAYAYDALTGAATLLGRPDYRDRAEDLRLRIIDQLWMPAEGYFAMGLDRDAEGRPRWIESIASNGALVLDTGVLSGLPAAADYVAALVRRICSPDFLTEAGIRCRPLSEDGLVGFQDYHGSWTVWMKETFEVTRGHHRQGVVGLARQIGNRILNAVNVAGANVEFLYVSPDGRVMYDFSDRDRRTAVPVQVIGTNQPEAPQTWTATSALALKWWYGSGRDLHGSEPPPAADGWRRALDEEELSRLPRIEALGTAAELAAAYAKRGDFAIDFELGHERDRRAREIRRGTEPLVLGR